MKKHRIKHKAPRDLHHQSRASVSSLASGIADDFNNILTTVMGACTLIDKDDPANGELRQYVTLIRTSAERAAFLSNQLMRASTADQENKDCVSDSPDSDSVVASERDKKYGDGIVPPTNHSGGAPS